MNTPVETISELFDHALDSSSGHLIFRCECGRTHFATFNNEGFYEDGELEALLEKKKADPDKFIDRDYSSISTGEFMGRTYALPCPCNGPELAKFERMIWSERVVIAKYLNARLKARAVEAVEDMENNSIKEAP